MRFDAVFFDSGGTLFDYRGSQEQGTPPQREVSDARGRRLTAILNAYGHACDEPTVEETLARAEDGIADRPNWSKVDVCQAVCEFLGFDVPYEELLCIAEAHTGPRYRSWLFPGTRDALSALHEAGLPLGLIANTSVPGYVFDRMLLGVGLLEFLTVRLYSCDEDLAKPDPAIFHRAAERLGVTGTRILYVGDSLEADVRGAKGVGWSAALRLSDHTPSSEGLADLEFSEWPDVVKWITSDGQ